MQVAPLPSEDELSRAICAPATRAGLSVERALVVQVLADAGRRPGALPLPLVRDVVVLTAPFRLFD